MPPSVRPAYAAPKNESSRATARQKKSRHRSACAWPTRSKFTIESWFGPRKNGEIDELSDTLNRLGRYLGIATEDRFRNPVDDLHLNRPLAAGWKIEAPLGTICHRQDPPLDFD
jgi:hypothetical protein